MVLGQLHKKTGAVMFWVYNIQLKKARWYPFKKTKGVASANIITTDFNPLNHQNEK